MSVFGRRARLDRSAPLPGGEPPAKTGAHAQVNRQPEPSAPPSPATRILGDRYEVGRLIGSGGTASVHVARDRLLGREVAIKLFRRDEALSPDLRLQEIEARVVATLNHYALTTLLDAGVDSADGGVPQLYLVMEYVRGATLRHRLRSGPIGVAEACWLTFDLAEGLDYMHQSGFLHRDVKPGNILISDQRSVRPVVAKLTDFGIAAAIGQPDLSEYTVGTAAYLSPEQVEGHDARPESDIYSLGLVLLEAMTGKVAFPGTVEKSAFDRLVRDPTIPDMVPDRVAQLLRSMTARKPDERIDLYQAAVDLQQFLVDDLVSRRTPPAQHDVRADAAPGRITATGRDPVFDRLLRVVAHALDVPNAALVVDDDAGSVVRAFVGWADGPQAAGAVADIPWDVASSAAPWSRAAGHAMAGAPLIAHSGRRVGMLIVWDVRTRAFVGTDLSALADLAGLGAHEIELRETARRALFT